MRCVRIVRFVTLQCGRGQTARTLQRSATVPATMVAAVAAKANWKNHPIQSPPEEASIRKKFEEPMNPFLSAGTSESEGGFFRLIHTRHTRTYQHRLHRRRRRTRSTRTLGHRRKRRGCSVDGRSVSPQMSWRRWRRKTSSRKLTLSIIFLTF